MISVQKMIFLYFCYAKIRHVTMITLRNNQTTITLHKYDKSWNEAQAICEDSNGDLFVEDSEEKSLVLEFYKSNDVWNNKQHAWIGLHYPAVLTGTSFGWTDCVLQEGSFDHFQPSEPKNYASSKCVLSDKTSGDWITDACDDLENFVCESVSAIDCTYDAASGEPDGTVSSTLTTTATDLSSCQDQCLQTLHDSMNCWAVTYDSSSSSCSLFYLDDPFYLQSGLSSSSQTTYIKNCYSEQVETTSRSATATDSSSPTQVCASYFPFTTTTTTSTTSTTTSTTSSTTSTTPTTTSTTSASPTTTSTTSSTTSTTSTTTSTTSSTTSTTPTTTSTTSASPTTTSTTSSTTSTTPTTTSTTSSTTSTTPTTTSTTSTTPTTTSTTPSTTPSASLTTSTTSSTTQTASVTTTTPSSTTTTTTPSTSSTTLTTSPFSLCKCGCSDLTLKLGSFAATPGWYNLTTEEKVALIVQKLRVDKSELSATIRKKTSASDDRTASKSVGYVAITFMAILFGLIVIIDLTNFVMYLSNKRKKLEINPDTILQKEPETSL